MRTMLIGALTPAIPATPGMRWPVRRITRPPTRSRSSAFGLPTSERSVGVTVAAFSPKPDARIASAASTTTAFDGLAAMLQGEIECPQLKRDTDHIRVNHPERLVEQLLAGLVATQDGDGGHRHSVRRRPDAATGRRDGIIAACRTR